ncbi:MAG: radical SAM protein [Candidatus Aminicenantes bacterium]|nr:radical SAM protein [Candidatus Aminicenantes bacterium]
MNPQQKSNPRGNTYGPVPSRRLGFSLGIDIIPCKTCTFNCIYCQLGPTEKTTIQRRSYYSCSEILSQLKSILSSGQRIDYITFSGSGEPTLNSILGKLIREIKKTTTIPVAVLTNSSLISRKSVREALNAADLVVPSLDAATQDVFLLVNRPHSSLKAQKIIQGLIDFRNEFQGAIWLEVMLVKGINDTPSHIQKLMEAIAEIKPEKVQLNTVIRPPAEKFALQLSMKELERIKNIIGPNCEIIAEFVTKTQTPLSKDLGEAIFSMIRRRPITLSDVSSSLGRNPNEILKCLDSLLKENKIKQVRHKESIYYEPK